MHPAAHRPTVAQRRKIGKGQMGLALMGSLQISCFLTEVLFGATNLSKSVNCAYLFPQSISNYYFCSDPISVDPICPQPRKPGESEADGRREGRWARGRRCEPKKREDARCYYYCYILYYYYYEYE